jgi:hypothetical protein
MPTQAMETQRGVKVRFHSFLTSELDGCECSNLCFGLSTLGNISSTRRREVWVDPRAVLEIMEKKIHPALPEIEPETHQPSAHSLTRRRHSGQRISQY